MISLPDEEILITGGRGFLGKFVVQRLRNLGCNKLFAPSHQELNLLDISAIAAALNRHQPKVLIHLAARVGGIGANGDNPGLFMYQNLLMGIQLIEQARLYGRLKKVVIVGTTCSYPKFGRVPFQETSLWDGYPEETNAPYGVAKKALFVLAEAYRRQYGIPSVCLIPANLYGPGDNFDQHSSHVIPSLIQKLIIAKLNNYTSVDVWGTGSATREFLYVEDCAEGVVAATEKYEGYLPLNIGCGEEITIAELLQLIMEVVGYECDVKWDASRPDGQPRRRLDVSRAAAEIGFKARTGLRTGLRNTVESYLSSL